jgi:predicted dehydrogenase
MKIGVIGAGGIANGIHLPLLARSPGVSLCAVCDLYAEKAQEAKENFGFTQSYVSYHEMLAREKLDAVFVLTQPDALFRAAADCLAAGKHVFMEKPMGVTAYQAQTLQTLAEEKNLVLHVGYNRRYIPLVQECLRILKETTTITLAEGRFYKNSSPAFYGGCASAFPCDVVHCVDLVRHVMGKSVTKSALLETNAESWHTLMRFAGGGSGVVRSHYATGGRVHGFEFHGPGASAYINLGFEGGPGCEATLLLANDPGRQSLSAMGQGKTEVIRLDGIALAGSGRYEDYYGYRDEQRLFFEAVRKGGYDAARTEEDLATARLIEQLMEAKL